MSARESINGLYPSPSPRKDRKGSGGRKTFLMGHHTQSPPPSESERIAAAAGRRYAPAWLRQAVLERDGFRPTPAVAGIATGAAFRRNMHVQQDELSSPLLLTP